MGEVLKRFEREAKSLAKLSHPNIVKVHDYGEHEGSPYLVMEYMPGGTLGKILGKPIPWQTALRLLLPVVWSILTQPRLNSSTACPVWVPPLPNALLTTAKAWVGSKLSKKLPKSAASAMQPWLKLKI